MIGIKKFQKMAVMVAGLSLVFFSACKKDDQPSNTTAGKAEVKMHLADGPSAYDAVYIDIKNVELTMSGSSAVTLAPIRPGVYDLLKFRNGLDTLLLRADIPTGTVSQIRLILGENNGVVVNGVVHSLNTPSAQESGLKLNLKDNFVAGGSYDVWIDFDAGKSIVETGSGKYQLKPVIRAYSTLTNGRIKGYVLPAAAMTTVYASNGIDTYAAIPNTDGFFQFSGLPEGTYTITYDATMGAYLDIVLPNITVNYGVTVDLGIKTLTP